jgi:hypothetical protein
MRALIQNTNAGCKNEDIMMPAHPSSWIEMYTIENATGKYLSGLITSSLTSAVTKKCQEDVLVTTTQAMFAIKAFKNDTGNYPISLSDLVPTYLPSVPLDPYGGKQLGYSREKKIIYSIGPGMQDFGGSTGGDWHTMTNPTFILNF